MTKPSETALYIPTPRKDRSWTPIDDGLLQALEQAGEPCSVGLLARFPRLRHTTRAFTDLSRDAHEPRRLIVWSGVGVSVNDLANNPADEQFLVLSTNDVDELTAQSSVFRNQFVPVVRSMTRIVVERDSLPAMAQKFPAYAANMVASDAEYEAQNAAVYAAATARTWRHLRDALAGRTRAVVLLRGAGMTTAPESTADGGTHVYWLDSGLGTSGEAGHAPDVSTVRLGVHNKHVVDGELDARHGAWQLASAARRLRASVLLTDDAGIIGHLARDEQLRDRLWFFLPEGTALDDGILEAVALSSRTVCNSEALRTQLERVTASSGISVLPTTAGVASPGPEDAHPDEAIALHDLTELLRSYLGPALPQDGEQTLVIAGHDFKFLGELVGSLSQSLGLKLLYDKWPQQNRRDVPQSDARLRAADIVLCEFASHNSVWYSWNKLPGQKLIVHFHGYEFFQPWMSDINVPNVDMFVFVSEFYRQKVVAELGWPVEKTCVVPNMVDLPDLDRPKMDDARFHLGIVGIVPILKRPDRALDLLETLLESDERYVLHVRGRSPWEYQWMWKDPAVQDAYGAFYERLSSDPDLLRHVAFDGFGADMGRWFRRIGWTLSPSSRETFHLAPVEGMAGGAVPVVWDREGAAEIFGDDWVHGSTDDCAAFILRSNERTEGFWRESGRARAYVRRYGTQQVLPLWHEVLFGTDTASAVTLDERFTRELMEERFAATPTADVLERYVRVLLEDEDVDGVELLLESHPSLAAQLSGVLADQMDAVRRFRAFMQEMSCLPARAVGAAYEPRRDSGLVVGPAAENPGAGLVTVTDHEVVDGTVVSGSPRLLKQAVTERELSAAELIHLSADAVLRECRVRRPAWIAAESTSVASWAALLTARRLGIPVLALGGPGGRAREAWAPQESWFDAAPNRGTELDISVVAAAQTHHDEQLAPSSSRRLEDLRIGIIADEFTTRTVSSCCTTVPIRRNRGYLQMAAEQIDALLVESAWEGPDREWFHGVAYYKDDRDDLEMIIEVARARNIPVIFWNKEDPVHFRSFAPTAALCDVVFSTDADKLPDYLELDTHGRAIAVGSMPFFAEPTLHNPLPTSREHRHTITYAGTYYGARYAERSAELDSLLEHAAPYGLTIYDRQLNLPNSPYHFPDKYEPYIEGGVPYAEVLEVYKAHPVHINVNSASGSPTMFSRRAVEIAASGAVVLSGSGRGLNECLPAILATDDERQWSEALERWMHSSHAWSVTVWGQLRAVRRSYLAEHALLIMLRTAGIPVAAAPRPRYAASVEHLDECTAQDILRQSWLPAHVQARSADRAAAEMLEQAGVGVARDEAGPATDWIVDWRPGLDENYAEDVLYAARFAPAEASRLGARASAEQTSVLEWSADSTLPVFRRTDADGSSAAHPVWIFPEEEK